MLKKRNLFCLLISLLVLISLSTGVAGANQNETISIEINGELQEYDTKPIFIDGRTLVPLRAIFESLDTQVGWQPNTQTITGENDENIIVLQVDNPVARVNSEEVILDTPAAIIDGRTMVPVRFIAESLNADVGWDHDTRTVIISKEQSITEIIDDSSTEIIETVIKGSNELEKEIEILKTKIVFESDIRNFNLYAFMNLTGYDEEYYRGGFTEVRGLVRKDLESMDLKLIDNSYFINKDMRYHHYTHVLAYLGGPPDFRPVANIPNYLSGLDDLPRHLEDFYTKANIEKLFEKYRPYYDKELARYSNDVYPAVAKINNYLKIDIDDVPSFYLQTNLLDSYQRGSGLGSGIDHYLGKGVIYTGPSEQPNIGNVIHEYLHGVITPINNNLKSEIMALSYMMEQDSIAIKQGYNDWSSIVDESIIRSLARIPLEESMDSYIDNNMQKGFILTKYFYERFSEFESFDGSLEEFIKMLLIDLKKSS